MLLLMIDPIVGGAIVSGASNLLGGIINGFGQKSANSTNLRIARETNAANFQMMQYQNEFNQKMLDKQNEYALPINQRKRFEDAGINPYFALSQISSGTPQGALQSAQGHPAVAAQVQPVTAFGDALRDSVSHGVNTYGQLMQAKYTQQQAEGQSLENRFKAATLLSRIDGEKAKNKSLTYNMMMDGLRADLMKYVNGNEMKKSDLSVAQMEALNEQMTLANAYQRIQNDSASIDLSLKKKYGEQQIIMSLAEVVSRIKSNYANIDIGWYNAKSGRMNAQANMLGSQASMYNARANMLGAQASMYNAQTNYQQYLVDRHLKGTQERFIVQQIRGQIKENTGKDISNLQAISLLPLVIKSVVLSNEKEQQNIDYRFFDSFVNGVGTLGGAVKGTVIPFKFAK